MFGTPAFGTTAHGSWGSSYSATGFIFPAQFGAPLAVFHQNCSATGFVSGAFGLANVYPGYVPGFSVADQFGAPIGRQRWKHVNAGPTTSIPTAYYTFAQALTATGAVRTVFGTPLGTLHVTVSTDRVAYAYGVTTTIFGAPTAGWPQINVATGFSSTQISAPSAVRQGAVAGFLSASLGAPTAHLFQRATPLPRPTFGAVSTRRIQAATGALFAQRFGTAASSRPDTYPVTGFTRAGRFGQPTGFVRINRTVTGFVSTQFGVPAARQRHRATMMPPAIIFGTPLLSRSTVC